MTHRFKERLQQHQESKNNLNTTVLNGYEITSTHLQWLTQEYRVEKPGKTMEYTDEPNAQQIIWELARDSGVIDASQPVYVVMGAPDTVIVPAHWELVEQTDPQGHKITRLGERMVDASNPADEKYVQGLLKRGFREHFKHSPPAQLGALWQDFNGFCEVPEFNGDDVVYCKRFEVKPQHLQGGVWVAQVALKTVSVSGDSFADHYHQGSVQDLLHQVELKQKNRETRRFGKTAVRALWVRKQDVQGATAVEVLDLEGLQGHARLRRADQADLETGTHKCLVKGMEMDVPRNELHLILDTQITQDHHDETILSTGVRADWLRKVRTALDGCIVFRNVVRLKPHLHALTKEPVVLKLPALKVRRSRRSGDVEVLPAPEAERMAITERMKARARKVRENGYVEEHMFSPLLAVPRKVRPEQAQRLLEDLNGILEDKNIPYRFVGPVPYSDAEEILRHCKKHDANALLAVLPESKRDGFSRNDTHEKIKTLPGMPVSQCIYFDNLLHPRNNTIPKHALPHRDKKVYHNYEAVLLNLLVKSGWVPFIPNAPFHFNVHIGIDVGGVFNDKAVACVGYGLSTHDMLFFAEQLHIKGVQAEPIPHRSLAEGLQGMLLSAIDAFKPLGTPPDLERVLFFRDGEFRGDGETWQELDGLKQLHGQFLEQGIVTKDSVWVGVEISKRARHWRQFHQSGEQLLNPLVGTVTFPFEDPNEALLATTGDPYLRQGTASPLLVRMHCIHGTFNKNEVLQDLLWESDLCFTKPDMGMRLPFVLHVADQGALQLSNKYHINGLPL